jgi:hypothetical protein
MASPVAHSLAGLSILALCFPRHIRSLTALATALFAACLPDLDLLIPGIAHRTVMHSVTFSLVLPTILFVWLKLNNNRQYLVITCLCFCGIISHIIIDWLSMDLSEPAGLIIGWPWNMDYQISDKPLFLNLHRNQFFEPAIIAHNTRALLRESIIMLPATLLILFYRRSYFSRV